MPPHRGLQIEADRRGWPRPCGGTLKRPFCERLEGLAHRRPWRHSHVIVSKKLRHLAGVMLGAAALCLPATLSAQGTSQNPPQAQTFVPSTNELSRLSMSGSYLAARHAGTQRDAGAAAAYYRSALRNDPKNTDLLHLAFRSVLAEGDVEEATRLAEQVITIDRNDKIARLVIGVKALKQKKYVLAKQNLMQSVQGPI